MIGIYKITSPTNKIYIGSSNDIKNRISKYKNLKCRSQRKLYNSLKKYGWDNHLFEIIEECDVKILLERELYYGIMFNVLDKETGLNSRLPKSGEHYTYMSEDTKRKIGEKNRIINKGKKYNFYESKLKKLTVEQVVEIKKLLYEDELTQKEISQIYNISRKIISNISSGKTYSYVKEYDLTNRKPINFKLKNGDIEIIMDMFSQGNTHKYIANFFGVDQSHITRIINKNKKGG